MANEDVVIDVVMKKLDAIKEQLDRMEKRQIEAKEIVEEVKEHEAPVVGSFATLHTGEKK